MKKSLLLVVLITSCLGLKSQLVIVPKKPYKNSIYIKAGYTLPFGAFISTRDDGGFANWDYGYSIGYQRNFKRFYTGVQFSLLKNRFNRKAFNEEVTQGTTAISTTSHDGYHLVAMNLTFGYNFFVGDDSSLFIGGHIMPGVGLYLMDDLENTTVNGNNRSTTTLSSIVAGDWAHSFGMKIRKIIYNDQFSIFGGFDYFFGSHSTSLTLKQTNNGVETLNEWRQYNLKYRNILFHVGCAIGF